MCFLYAAEALAPISYYFVTTQDDVDSSIENEISFEGVSESMKVLVPEHPLAPNSLRIEPKKDVKKFTDWNDINIQETHVLIQRIVDVWQKMGITDYLIYGKESDDSKSAFGWEIVPYRHNEWRFWRFWNQLKVLWNISFGSLSTDKTGMNKVITDFEKNRKKFIQASYPQNLSIRGNDAFCNQKIIEKQRVFEGRTVNILYNYAPIGKEKLHFLIVPKEHHVKFSDLTMEEYEETMKLSQKLINFYKSKGIKTVYLFDKSGTEAGQTVPHWHEHVVFTATKTQEFIGKLTILKNMLIGSSSLSDDKLKKQVEYLKNELRPVLSD